MTFPILGANSAVGGYAIDNSLRFNKADTPRLVRTPSESNRRTFTLSCWIKRSAVRVSYEQSLYEVRPSAGTYFGVSFRNTGSPAPDELLINSSAGSFTISLQGVFRDVSAWYHIVLAFDTTQGTSSNRIKFYVNGNQVSTGYYNTYPAQNTDLIWNTNNEHRIGGSGFDPSADSSNFYLTEIHHIDGQQLDASSFGEFDEDSGIWKPIEYTGTYGTNGFYLDFENSGSLGADSSPNSNSFTPTNLASTDQTTDTPTNNFATLNALDNYYANSTFSEGNVKISQNNNAFNTSTMKMSSGKWYWEAKLGNTSGYDSIGITQNVATSSGQVLGDLSTAYGMRSDAGQIITNNSGNSYGVSFTSGDIIGVGLDLDNNKLYFSKNGTWMNSADPSAGTGGFSISAGEYFAGFGKQDVATGSTWEVNFGNPNFSISSGNSDANGYGNMEYSFPTNYLALCTQNLATELSPTIDDGSAYFQTALWSGTGGALTVTNDGNSDLKPDFLWVKNRNNAGGHRLHDSNRPLDNTLKTHVTDAEGTETGLNMTFETDGFSLNKNAGDWNLSGRTYVGWQWKANGGTTSSNTDGSITSTVQANTTAGFSIVTYTGNGTAGATVGHGLGKKPDMIIAKNRNTTSPSRDWLILHKAYEGTSAENIRFTTMALASAGSQALSGWYRTAPTSSVFYLGNGSAGDYSGDTNISGGNMIAYCFAEIEGYSKFGKYTGNGSTDGTFVYTGFRPAFVLTKRTDTSGYSWGMADSKRSPYNQANEHLFANASDAEYTTLDKKDLLSNGFKHRTNLYGNLSGGTYIYMAFAENPFVSSTSIPVTAR